eukprot:3934417-Rhodomonas_salina.2
MRRRQTQSISNRRRRRARGRQRGMISRRSSTSMASSRPEVTGQATSSEASLSFFAVAGSALNGDMKGLGLPLNGSRSTTCRTCSGTDL